MKKPEVFLRLPDVIKRIGLSGGAIYQRMNKGLFPKSFSLGGRAVVWSESELIEWMEVQKSERKCSTARIPEECISGRKKRTLNSKKNDPEQMA